MIRYFVLLLCVVLAATLLGLAIGADAGYVFIAYKSFRYQTGLWQTLAILAVFCLGYLGLRQVLRLMGVSSRAVNPWSGFNRRRRTRLAEEQGQRALAEGHWHQALHYLRRAAELSEQPLVHYLGAARAASELGRYAECDALLQRAQQRGSAELAVGLTQAQLLINRGDLPAARQLLEALYQDHPRHDSVLRLLQQLYVSQRDWRALCLLLPNLRKLRVLKPRELDDLEAHAWMASLVEAAEQGMGQGESSLQPLNQCWQGLPIALRRQAALVAVYAQQLLRLGAPLEAEEVLRKALKDDYEPALVRLYGLAGSRDLARQLQTAEGWLKASPDDAELLLALARLSLRSKLWGKARGYLEASLAVERRAETCAELARLFVQLGEVERSNRLFQEGLELLSYSSSLPVAVTKP